jgi:hypothetical protein
LITPRSDEIRRIRLQDTLDIGDAEVRMTLILKMTSKKNHDARPGDPQEVLEDLQEVLPEVDPPTTRHLEEDLETDLHPEEALLVEHQEEEVQETDHHQALEVLEVNHPQEGEEDHHMARLEEEMEMMTQAKREMVLAAEVIIDDGATLVDLLRIVPDSTPPSTDLRVTTTPSPTPITTTTVVHSRVAPPSTIRMNATTSFP